MPATRDEAARRWRRWASAIGPVAIICVLVALYLVSLPSTARADGTTLVAGENHVSYTGPSAPVAEALHDALAAVSAVWYQDPAGGQWHGWVAGSPFLPAPGLTELVTGREYLVYAREPAAWPSAQPSPRFFTDVTEAAGLIFSHRDAASPLCDPIQRALCEAEYMSGGAAVADYDGDGYVDVYVTRLDRPDLLYRNRGDGTFEDRTADSGLDRYDLHANGAGWADVDNDGDPDLYVTTVLDSRFYLFVNDGEGRFTEEAQLRGASVEGPGLRSGFSVAFGDYDRDGWVDLHVNEWQRAIHDLIIQPSGTTLLRNRGTDAPGFFEAGALGLADGAEPWGVSAFASAFVDLDQDGWPDLAAAADFGRSRVFWNTGDGTFDEGVGVADGVNGMGSALGDVDSDGFLDWFISGIYEPAIDCAALPCSGITGVGNRLYGFAGDRTMFDMTDAAGVADGGWGWGSVFLDYDNDADLDLAMTNGFTLSRFAPLFDLEPMRLWENDGSGAMTERASERGIADPSDGRGLLTFDYDRDGDLDLLTLTNTGSPRLFRNDEGNSNAWLRVRVEGVTSNRDGYGARVTVVSSPGAAPQFREIGARSHFLGQSELTEHFGLGPDATRVHEVHVEWPASGAITVLTDIEANQEIVVREGEPGFSTERAGVAIRLR